LTEEEDWGSDLTQKNLASNRKGIYANKPPAMPYLRGVIYPRTERGFRVPGELGPSQSGSDPAHTMLWRKKGVPGPEGIPEKKGPVLENPRLRKLVLKKGRA